MAKEIKEVAFFITIVATAVFALIGGLACLTSHKPPCPCCSTICPAECSKECPCKR